MSLKTYTDSSLLVRFLSLLYRYGTHSRIYACFCRVPAYYSRRAIDGSVIIKLLAGLAGMASIPLQRAAAALHRSLPTSALHNARLPGVIKGSRLYNILAGLRVETLLWPAVFYIVLDYAIRTFPYTAFLASGWDELLLLSIFILWPVQMALRGNITYRHTPVDLPLLIFLGLTVFLFLVRSPDTGLAMEGARVYIEYTLWFFVGANLLLNIDQAKALVKGMVVITALVAAHGIYQYVVGVEMPASWVDAAEAGVRTRVFSVTGSPNVLGSFFVLFIPVTISQLLHSRGRPARYFYLGCLALAGFSLIVTYSRGAWLALAGGLVIYSVLYNWRVLVPMTAAAVVSVQVFPGIVSRLAYMLSPAYLASSQRAGRLARWQLAIAKIKQSPLLGEGFGRFGGAVAARNIPGSFYVDNFYLKTAAEAGLTGLAALLYLLFAVARAGINAYTSLRNSYLKSLAAGILAGLVGVMLHNGVENIFEVPMMATYFWLMAGFLTALPFIDE